MEELMKEILSQQLFKVRSHATILPRHTSPALTSEQLFHLWLVPLEERAAISTFLPHH